MVAKGGDTEDLFHAVWLESGAIQPLGWADEPQGQQAYDNFVEGLGCSGAADTFACAKQASALEIAVAGAAYQHWQPHADGDFITGPPQHAMINGDIARIPVIAGQ